jgi:hypothetical protein
MGGVVTEWGVRYLDGVIMGRPNKWIAEQSVIDYPGRMLMQRIGNAPWRPATCEGVRS